MPIVSLQSLYHGVPLRIYGRYRTAGLTKVTIHGDVQGQPFEQSIELDLPATDDANPEIERMWAWKRVDQLLATARANGQTAQVVDEVVRLCEDYSIVSEYASFIVLENDAEYRRWKIERKNLSRVQRDRAALRQVNEQLAAARTEALNKLGPTANASPRTEAPSSQRTTPDQVAVRTPARQRQFPTNRGFDLDLTSGGAGGGSGGGAIDPISATIGLGLAGAAALAARRRNSASADSEK